MHAPVVSGAEDQVHGQGTELAVAGNPTKLLCLQGCKGGSSVSQEGCQVTGTASVMPSPTRVQEGEEKKELQSSTERKLQGKHVQTPLLLWKPKAMFPFVLIVT